MKMQDKNTKNAKILFCSGLTHTATSKNQNPAEKRQGFERIPENNISGRNSYVVHAESINRFPRS